MLNMYSQNSGGAVEIPGGVVKIWGCGYCPHCNSRKVGTYVLHSWVLWRVVE